MAAKINISRSGYGRAPRSRVDADNDPEEQIAGPEEVGDHRQVRDV
jgi:hypothetical protein